MLGYHSYFSRNVNKICHKNGLNIEQFLNLSASKIVKKIKNANIFQDWRCKLIQELLIIRDGKMTCQLDKNELNELLQYVCTG